MNLTADQLQAIKKGEPVRVLAPEIGEECVVLRADLFERVRSVLQEGLSPEQVGLLIEQTMREYDEADPLLERYQRDLG